MQFTNKVVIITGGTSGIGQALAEVLGKAGARIVITGRNQEALKTTAEALKAQSIEVLAIKADVSKEEDNKMMAETTFNRFGRIDVLINNAGISMRALFEEVDLAVIKQVMDINFYGAVYATKHCLPYLLESKGTVVGISSVAGFRGVPARTGYSASKFALQGFLEALRTEMMYKGVNVLIASPGFIATNIRERSLTKDGSAQGVSPRDEKAMMTAEECAELIKKAILKRKKYLIITLQGKLTVFLNKLFPVFMDKMVYNHMAKEDNAPIPKS